MTDQFTVVHAANFEEEDRFVFGHAAAFAFATRGKLVALHADDGTGPATADGIVSTVADWGITDVQLEVISHACCDDPVDTLLDGLRALSPDLVVVGSHQKRGIRLLAEGSISQAMLANAGAPVLVVPLSGRGIVDAETGLLGIRRVLVPVESDDTADRALAWLTDVMERLGVDDLDIFVMHVGQGDVLDSTLFPERPGWRGHRLQREGSLPAAIEETAEERGIDLIVMPTRGSDSLMDVFSGTNTEKTMRIAHRPLLALPMK